MSNTTASVLQLLCQTLWLSCQTLQLQCWTLVLISDTTSVRISGKTLQHRCQDTAFHFGHHHLCICWTQHLPCQTLVLKTVASVSAAITSVLNTDYYMKHCSLYQILWLLCQSVCSVSVWFPCQIHYCFYYFMSNVVDFVCCYSQCLWEGRWGGGWYTVALCWTMILCQTVGMLRNILALISEHCRSSHLLVHIKKKK